VSVPQSIQRLSEDANTSREIRSLLRASELDGPSDADLARFAARMAPLVGLSAAELSPTMPHGPAPADVSSGSWAGAGTQGSLAKVGSSFALKAVLAGTLSAALGLGVWWSSRPAVPAQSVREHATPAAVRPQQGAPSSPAPASAAPEVSAAMPAVAEPVAMPLSKRAPVNSAVRPDELSLIAQAQGLRDQPQALLRVLKQHAALYPHGMLAQEREVLAVEALLAAGQLKEAKRRAGHLAAEYPNSAHLPRIRALLDQASRE